MADKKPSMEDVILSDGRYPLGAYAFLHEGLTRAGSAVYGDEAQDAGEHHVTGQQICEALRELAIERWGRMARVVLDRWGIRSTMDFGNMVYLMISHEFMRKTEEDSLEDFRDVYDFEKVFAVEGKSETPHEHRA